MYSVKFCTYMYMNVHLYEDTLLLRYEGILHVQESKELIIGKISVPVTYFTVTSKY